MGHKTRESTERGIVARYKQFGDVLNYMNGMVLDKPRAEIKAYLERFLTTANDPEYKKGISMLNDEDLAMYEKTLTGLFYRMTMGRSAEFYFNDIHDNPIFKAVANTPSAETQNNSPLWEAAASGQWATGKARHGWINNGDGTFTAKQGATLWVLYGSQWREKSGFTGDPEKLQAGTVVGRNEVLIQQFDTEFGSEMRDTFGEEFHDEVRDFFVQNLAYPARQASVESIIAFLKNIGVEMEEVDPENSEIGELFGKITMQEGTDVHKEIAKQYRKANKKDESIRTNTTPIRTILREFPEFHEDIPKGIIPIPTEGDLRRPDITSIENCIIYEIKPSPRLDDARGDLEKNRGILNTALEPVRQYIALPRSKNETIIPGPNSAPGLSANENNPKHIEVKDRKYSYWSPENGIILYKRKEEKAHELQTDRFGQRIARLVQRLLKGVAAGTLLIVPTLPLELEMQRMNPDPNRGI